MRDETFESEASADWNPVALRGGVASLRVPSTWQRLSRDDGGLAFQSPGAHPVDLLISVVTYRNPYGARAEEAIQYLDRENVLPRGILPSMESGDAGSEADERHWIAYAVAQPPDRQIFVWKVADFQPPDHVRVVTLQLLVPDESADDPELSDLIDRLGEEAARIKFNSGPVQGPVQRVTMRNVWHADSVRFRLPWDWNSAQDNDLSMFYRDVEGSGTLRVAVHQFDHEGDDAEILARAVLRQTAEQFAEGPDERTGEGSIEWLPDGEVMARFVTDGEEDGEKLRFFLWLRGVAIDGQTTVALFSFAFPQASRGGDLERSTLVMLEQEIRRAVIGITDSTEVEEDGEDGFSLADLLDEDDLLLDDDLDDDQDDGDDGEDAGGQGPVGRA
ncbi:hypothetical protein [Niveispirillum sp.]|uniref:hypothetical protein n=1 Tax=Niveispirillum sp. TaxID=1917217 RepID=UPI001B791690|nr:hypothetical protein [Niveispirillum sp.]MBP7336342.1 hypothetical protein [Niveispirillum sp.]